MDGLDSVALGMTTPTYRSINLTATLLGIDRRLCIAILLIAFLVFRHASFVSALFAFGLLWSIAYWITKHDIQLIVIVPKAVRQRRIYDPARLTA
jgi:type IV secretory pathway TrbD component